MRECRRDVGALRGLTGHSRIDATQLYTDEVELDELDAALERAAASRMSQASPDPTTLETEPPMSSKALGGGDGFIAANFRLVEPQLQVAASLLRPTARR